MPDVEIIPVKANEIHSIAEQMRADGRILTMIQGYLENDGTPVVTYDFDFGPVLKEYEIRGESTIPTISDVYDAAAEWPERELMELMKISFEGVNTEDRLFMPNNLLDGKGQILVTPMTELKEKNQPEENADSGTGEEENKQGEDKPGE